MFLFVSLSKSKFFTRGTLVSQSCHSCLTRVALVLHLCCSCRSRIACVWHLYCKLDWISRKQCVRINNLYIKFKYIAQQQVHFYSAYQLTIIFFNKSSSIHNFADDNTLSALANAISDLVKKLQSDNSIAIKRFKMNKMIKSPDKFRAIVLNKKRSKLTNIN